MRFLVLIQTFGSKKILTLNVPAVITSIMSAECGYQIVRLQKRVGRISYFLTSAVKVNALTQMNFNAVNFFNERLTHAPSV